MLTVSTLVYSRFSHKLPSKARGADSIVELSDYEDSEDEGNSSDEESGEHGTVRLYIYSRTQTLFY